MRRRFLTKTGHWTNLGLSSYRPQKKQAHGLLFLWYTR